MAIIGIDLGTTNSLVAVFLKGDSILIPNEYDEFLTPSVVSLTEEGQIIVGKAAKERLITHPDKTVSVFKRTMGKEKLYSLGKKNYFSEELSAFVLQSLKADAERFLGEEVTEAVISVPAYFDESGRQATKRAGEIAGLKVERIINEPSAAALACRMEKRKELVANTVYSVFHNEETDDADDIEDQTYMIFDFGGGTLDISLVECFENVISVTAVSGNNHLGGSDIDRAIAEYFCNENKVKFDLLDENTKKTLLKQAEKSKIALSEEKESIMWAWILGREISITLTSENLIKICADVLQQILSPISKVLKDSQTTVDEIDEIVLIGGSGKMPMIANFLEISLGKKPITIGTPDTMVAIGMGIYAGMKERNEEIKDIVMTDICPFTLGVDIHNEENPNRPYMSAVIERNTVLPCTKTGRYYPISVTQKEVLFNIYQGEGMYADENIFLGKLRIRLPKYRKEREPIELRMTYNINGILEVEATVLSTGEYCHNYIIREGGLSDEETRARKLELEKVKKENQDDAKYRFLIERAESLFREASGPLRIAITQYISFYENIKNYGTPLKIKRFTEDFEKFLNTVEGTIDMYGLDESEVSIEENINELLDDIED